MPRRPEKPYPVEHERRIERLKEVLGFERDMDFAKHLSITKAVISQRKRNGFDKSVIIILDDLLSIIDNLKQNTKNCVT